MQIFSKMSQVGIRKMTFIRNVNKQLIKMILTETPICLENNSLYYYGTQINSTLALAVRASFYLFQSHNKASSFVV